MEELYRLAFFIDIFNVNVQQARWRINSSFVVVLCGFVREGDLKIKDEALKLLFNLFCHADSASTDKVLA